MQRLQPQRYGICGAAVGLPDSDEGQVPLGPHGRSETEALRVRSSGQRHCHVGRIGWIGFACPAPIGRERYHRESCRLKTGRDSGGRFNNPPFIRAVAPRACQSEGESDEHFLAERSEAA